MEDTKKIYADLVKRKKFKEEEYSFENFDSWVKSDTANIRKLWNDDIKDRIYTEEEYPFEKYSDFIQGETEIKDISDSELFQFNTETLTKLGESTGSTYSLTQSNIDRYNSFDDAIARAAKEKGGDADLIKMFMFQETRMQKGSTSPAGYKGLAQTNQASINTINRNMNTDYTMKQMDDPYIAASYMADYMKLARTRYGAKTPEELVVAYNRGFGKVKEYKEGKDTLPEETKGYISAISALVKKKDKETKEVIEEILPFADAEWMQKSFYNSMDEKQDKTRVSIPASIEEVEDMFLGAKATQETDYDNKRGQQIDLKDDFAPAITEEYARELSEQFGTSKDMIQQIGEIMSHMTVSPKFRFRVGNVIKRLEGIKKHFPERTEADILLDEYGSVESRPIADIEEDLQKIEDAIYSKLIENEAKPLLGGPSYISPITPNPKKWVAYTKETSGDNVTIASLQLIEDTENLKKITTMDKTHAGNILKGTGDSFVAYFEDYIKIGKDIKANRAIKKINNELVAAGNEDRMPIFDNRAERALALLLYENDVMHLKLDHKIPRSYKVGLGLGSSLGFMTEMGVTGGIGGVGKKIAYTGIRKILIQGGRKLSTAALQTAAMPSFYKGAIIRTADAGNVKDAALGLANAYIDTYQSVLSERLFTGKPKGLTKATAYDTFLKRIGSDIAGRRGLMGTTKATLNEYFEEQVEGGLRILYNPNGTRQDAINAMTDKEEQITTLMTVGTMTSLFGGVQLIANTTGTIRNELRMQRVKGKLDVRYVSNLDNILKQDELSVEEMQLLISEELEIEINDKNLSDAGSQQLMALTVEYSIRQSKAFADKINKQAALKEEQKQLDWLIKQGIKVADGTSGTEVTKIYHKAQSELQKKETLKEQKTEKLTKTNGKVSKEQKTEQEDVLTESIKKEIPIKETEKKLAETETSERVETEQEGSETTLEMKAEEDAELISERINERTPEVKDSEIPKIPKEPEVKSSIPYDVLVKAKKAFDRITKDRKDEALAGVESFKTIERSKWHKGLDADGKAKAKEDYFNIHTERFTARPTEKTTREKLPSKKVPKKQLLINDTWQEYLRQAKERQQYAKEQLGETKDDLRQSRESLLGFIKDNKKELSRLKGQNITSMLRALTSESITQKQVDIISEKLNTVIERNEKRVAKEYFKAIKKIVSEFKPFVTEGGIKKSKAGARGEKFKQDAKQAFDITAENKETELKKVQDQIEELENKLNDTFESDKEQIMSEINSLRQTYEVIDNYAGLENSFVEELDIVSANLKSDIKTFTKEHQDWQKGIQEVKEKRNADVASDIFGSRRSEAKAKGRLGYTADIEKQKKRGKSFTRVYHKFFGTIASMAKRIDQSYRQGMGGGTAAIEKLIQDLRRGTSVQIGEENRMKDILKSKLKSLYGGGGLRKIVRETKQKITINTIVEGKSDIIGSRSKKRKSTWSDKKVESKKTESKYKIRKGTAAKMWAAWKYGGSNKKYMESIGMTQELYEHIDSKLSDNLKSFSSFLIEKYYSDTAAKAKISDTYKKFTNSSFPFEDNYMPMNAKAIVDVPAFGSSNMNIFKGFTKQRKFGDFDMFNNDIVDGAFAYAEDYAKFVGLAEPVSNLYGTLSSNKVRNALRAEGLSIHGEQMKRLLERGYIGTRESAVATYLRRVFVGTKIRANMSLIPKQMISFMASLDGDYGSPIGIMREWKNLATEKETRKLATTIHAYSAQYKYRHILDVETLSNKKGFKMSPEMFGKGKKEKIAATAMMLLWNPSQVADKWAIAAGGLPIISYNYKQEYKRLIKRKFSETEAKEGASDYALGVFEKYMNETQQSGLFTDISEFQTGLWKNATFFMNTPLAYSRKIMSKSRNLSRGYVSKKVQLLKDNPKMTEIEASVKAFSGMRQRDFGGLFLYSFALPFLFQTTQKTGTNIYKYILGDDEEKKNTAINDLLTTGTTAAKGFFPLGLMADYASMKVQGKTYGSREDNVVRTLDDTFQTIDDLVGLIKYLNKQGTPDADQERLNKYIKRSVINLGGFAGLPTVAAKRFNDALFSGDYDNASMGIARIYGMRKEDIDIWFGEKDKKQKPIIIP